MHALPPILLSHLPHPHLSSFSLRNVQNSGGTMAPRSLSGLSTVAALVGPTEGVHGLSVTAQLLLSLLVLLLSLELSLEVPASRWVIRCAQPPLAGTMHIRSICEHNLVYRLQAAMTTRSDCMLTLLFPTPANK